MVWRMARLRIVAGIVFLIFACRSNAQSTVTLYGIVDSGLLYTSRSLVAPNQSGGGQLSLTGSGLSPSLFGLKGSEDLGGGLKAIFNLESGISMADGSLYNSNGNMFGRQAWVGIDGGFGTVKFGLQFSPFFISLYDLDPRGFSMFGSGGVIYVNNVVATGYAAANALSYSSPNLAGFQVRLMYTLGGTPGDFQAGRQYSGSLSYDNGSLLVNAAIFDGNAGGTAQSTPVPTTIEFIGRMLGAGYRFGPVTVKASFVNYKVAGSHNNNVYGGGAQYFIAPNFNVNGGVWYSSDRNDTSNHSLMGAVGAEYFLSKATTIYAQMAFVNNHGTINNGLAIDGALNAPQGTTTGGNIGIRHIF